MHREPRSGPSDGERRGGRTVSERVGVPTGRASPQRASRHVNASGAGTCADPERVGPHDPSAASDVVTRHLPRLRQFGTFLLRRGRLDVDSNLDDIVQTALLAALVRGPCCCAEARWQEYVCGELRNAVRHLRRHVGQFSPTAVLPDHFEDWQLSPAMRRSELVAALGALPSNWLQPLLLRFVDGYRIADISDCLAIPASTVKWRLAKALSNAANLRAVRDFFGDERQPGSFTNARLRTTQVDAWLRRWSESDPQRGAPRRRLDPSRFLVHATPCTFSQRAS